MEILRRAEFTATITISAFHIAKKPPLSFDHSLHRLLQPVSYSLIARVRSLFEIFSPRHAAVSEGLTHQTPPHVVQTPLHEDAS